MARVLNVIHSRQETETGCLAACVQMVLNYLGFRRSQVELGQQMHALPNVGIIGRKVLALQSATLKVIYTQSTLAALQSWLAQDMPVIVFIQTAELPYWNGLEARHAIVLVGMAADQVFLLDPARAPEVIAVSRGDFALAWDAMDERCIVFQCR